MPQSLPGSIREGFTEEEEVGLSLRLEGWVGVYQLSTGERASRQGHTGLYQGHGSSKLVL